MLNPVLEIDYDFPKKFLLDFFEKFYPNMKDYNTPEYLKGITELDDTVPGFKVDEVNYFNKELREVSQQFCDTYNIEDEFSPHFLVVEPNSYLPWHVDGKEATCAVNCLLSNDNVPVEFDSGNYNYNTALLNIRERHRVQNGPTQRVIFRISFVGKLSYDEIYNKILNRDLNA